MTNMREIDEGIKQTVLGARHDYLIRQFNKLGTYHDAGTPLHSIELPELEYLHISAKNRVARKL